MTVGQYSLNSPCTITPKATAREAAWLMKTNTIGSLIVVRRNKPVGMLTDRDLALRVLRGNRNASTLAVEEIMSTPVITVREDAPLSEGARLMREHALRRLPVVDRKGSLMGVLTADDLLCVLAREIGSLADTVLDGLMDEAIRTDHPGRPGKGER
ncbi:MAG: CBS domain-containing protein [Planctomycetota bacterium]|nr:MAG: CBS domain-containing protein [Planctomycetota bacterium]